MANVQRLVQDLGKPYITFENTEARELGPDVCNDPSPSKVPKRTQLPGSWDGKVFDYSPLDSARQVIRLLYLHPGEGGDPIICSLRETELKSSEWPAYNALSYQWGDPTPTKPIHILDSGIIDVRQNLYDALVQLRSRYEDKIFWIDAVCMYSYRTAMKHLGNLRFIPQFSEGFHAAYLVDPIRTYQLIWAPWSWFGSSIIKSPFAALATPGRT